MKVDIRPDKNPRGGNTMNDHGIAWMIAGGVRAESAEDQRQRLHRVAIAHSAGSRGDTLQRVRERIGAIVGARSLGATDAGTLSADCCAA
jgi:hypothetical protein